MPKAQTPMKEEKAEPRSQCPHPQPLSTPREHLIRPAATFSPSDAEKGNPLGEGQDEMLTKRELAARLKVNVRTIERWQHQGHLPYLKVTTVILFHWPTVVKHLTENFEVAARGVVKPVADAGRQS